jgi:hypothetical protein
MNKMKIAYFSISIIFMFVLCSKVNKEELSEISSILVAQSINQSGKLLTHNELNEMYFKVNNISIKYQPKFIEIYDHLRADLSKLSSDYYGSVPVRYFLINKYLNQNRCNETSTNDYSDSLYATERNPYYMAFAIYSENFVNLQTIGNDTYIRSLARSFNVPPGCVYEGIWTCLLNTRKVVFEKVALIVKNNLHDQKINDPSFYFINILLPYYRYLSNGFVFSPSMEDTIFKQFGKTFQDPNAETIMRNYSYKFKDYLMGASLNVKWQNDFNSILSKHLFRLELRQRSCVGYRISPNCIKINRNQTGNVLFIKKVSVSFSNPDIGLSTVDENDVVVKVDDIFDMSQEIKYDLDHSLQMFSCSRFGSVWQEQNLGFSISKADSILFKLLQKEFNGKTVQTISEMITKHTSIHEAKHKWDEKNSTQKHWYNIDCEISAHLTCCALSGSSYYSLTMALMNLEDYYKNIGQTEVREKILKLLRDCWQLAETASEGAIDEKQVAIKAIEIYNAYSMVDGDSLPSIARYSKTIVTIIDSTFSAGLIFSFQM